MPHDHKQRRVILIALGLLGIAAAVIFAVNQKFSFGVYMLASTIVLLDGIDLAVRLWIRYNATPLVQQNESQPPLKPYAVILSVFNAQKDLDLILKTLTPYKEHVWFVDDCSTDGTSLRLQEAGWHCLKSSPNRKKPGALKYLINHLPKEIATVVVLDPDIDIQSDLEKVLAEFQASQAAALCPRLTIRPDGMMAEFQNIEYTISFRLGRQSLNPTSITSGIAIYNRKALEKVLMRHSLSVYAEDLENSLLLLAEGHSVVYEDKLVIETDAKKTLRSWFSQRVGWSFGFIKVYTERFAEIRAVAARSPMAFYQYLIYFGLLSLIAWPLKLVSFALLSVSLVNAFDMVLGLDLVFDDNMSHPGLFAAIYLKYISLILIAYQLCAIPEHRIRGLRMIPLYPIYSFMMVIATTVGYANWLSLKLFGRRVYKDHYDERPMLGKGMHNG